MSEARLIELRNELDKYKQLAAPLEAELQPILAKIEVLQREFQKIDWQMRREKSVHRQQQREKLEREAEEHWSVHLQVGDIVRVRGTRDTKNPYRKVVKLITGRRRWGYNGIDSFSGEKCRKLADGTFFPLGVYTTNGVDKIAEKVG